MADVISQYVRIKKNIFQVNHTRISFKKYPNKLLNALAELFSLQATYIQWS